MLTALVATMLLAPQSERYGKSADEIVAMGRKAWYDFATKRTGETTHGMAQAEYAFGEALSERTEARLRARPLEERLRVLGLRRSLRSFAGSQVDYKAAGGGTMWIPVAASRFADVEELVADLAARRYGKTPARVVSDVARPLKAFAIPRPATDDAEERAMFARREKAIGAMRAEFATLVKRLAKSPRRESDCVLEFCRDLVANLYEEGG